MIAATGQMQEVQFLFGHHQSVEHAAVLVLLALSALISQGLLQAREIYQPLPKGYYGLEHILLLLANMALLRIYNSEQLKTCQPGELGKIMGLDRVPEVKCLREKLSQIVLQNKAKEFERHLSKKWIEQQACLYFYIDGHVRIYHGHQATLQKKFASRQKLCLAGTTEYWVNDHNGQPLMFFIGDLNERLKDAIQQPNYQNSILKVTVHSQATPRGTKALKHHMLTWLNPVYFSSLFKAAWIDFLSS